MKSHDRGDYRPLYCALKDDPDFHGLSWLASRLLVVLKLELPASGIGVVYPAQLTTQCKCTPLELEEAFAELERPKPTAGYGWVVRERNIVWIVNGLRFEPTLSPQLDKHRKFVQRSVLPLGDKPRVVRAFRDYYPEYFPTDGQGGSGTRQATTEVASTNGIEGHSHSLSEGYRMPMQRVSNPSDSDSDSDITGAITSDSDSDMEALRAAPLAFADLPLEVLRFAREFYGDADNKRKTEIRDQLLAALSPLGAKLRRDVFVQARSVEHLSKCCRDVILEHHAHPLRDPDKAIVVLLKKLQDEPKDAKGRTVSDRNVEAERDARALEEAYCREREICGEHWADEHPDERRAIEQRVSATIPGPDSSAFVARARRIAVLTECATASGFPDFDTWRTRQRPRLMA